MQLKNIFLFRVLLSVEVKTVFIQQNSWEEKNERTKNKKQKNSWILVKVHLCSYMNWWGVCFHGNINGTKLQACGLKTIVVFHEDDLLPEMPLYLLSLIWKSSVVYEAILWVKTCKSVHNVVLGRYFKAFQTIWCRSDYIWSCVASFWTLLTKR